MSAKYLELYIDESGDFNDARPERTKPEELSMVGGLLCDPEWLTKERMDAMLPNRVHAKDGYNKRYLDVLSTLQEASCRFIVFENTERIRVVNPQITYANIISEGLVKLFRDLAAEYPEGVRVHVVIAQRQLQLAQYRDRLIERVRMAYGRNHVTGCDYELEISDARYDKRLFFADIICNTYLTRRREKKFTLEEQQRISRMFEAQWVYPVFEDATVMYIKQLYAEEHYGEMMRQISALPRLQGLSSLRDKLLRRMAKANRLERKHWFSQMSMELGLCNDNRDFLEGIALAVNYKRYFLDHFADMPETADEVRFWQFDTDFYLLTMYDHLGDAGKCESYQLACRGNLSSVNRSWEHMDYYFRFCLRELNVLMGRFAFQEVLEKADDMTKSFREVSEVFQRIGERDGTGSDFRSELLGKVQGIRLEALINLIAKDPDYIDEALRTSDQALREFTRPEDLQRQWQYRCQLMVSAGLIREAKECLLRSLAIGPDTANPYEEALARIYADERRTDLYSLAHYTHVLSQLAERGIPDAEAMGKAIMQHPRFLKELRDPQRTGHPWNRVLWNTGRYARTIGDLQLSDMCYERALEVTREDPRRTTMMTFALSITAERWLHADDRPEKVRAALEKDWQRANHDMQKGNPPKELQRWFGVQAPDAQWQALAWLK